MRTRQSGFTLLEVLIAIVITSLIGLGSWQLLNSAIRTHELTQSRIEEFSALQRAMLFIKRDLQQVAARAIRDEYGDYQPAVTTRNQFYAMEFTRSGWRNPLQDPRSDLQRVAYEIEENTLRRHYWLVLDRAQDSQPISRDLLESVESLSLRFMNSSGGWTNEWPPDREATNDDKMWKYNDIPTGIELSLVHQRFGEIKILVPQAQYMAGQVIKTSTSDGGAPNPEGEQAPNAEANR